jgi:hypothetical protein
MAEEYREYGPPDYVIVHREMLRIVLRNAFGDTDLAEHIMQGLVDAALPFAPACA